MKTKKPYLKSPAPCWQYDLPRPNDPPTITPLPSTITYPPNHANENYLELHRRTIRNRGIGLLCAACMLLACILNLTTILDINTTKFQPEDFLFFSFELSTLALCIWLGTYYYRMDTEAPLDAPIRFNRSRRKVYVYRFHSNGLRPFSRKSWGVRVEVYDWDQLHAEACSVYRPMGTGGLIETVTLAVLEPGTDKVLDRFHFALDIQQGEMYWAMAQLFMQQGPHALPTFDRPPRDWNNEDVTFNLARRLAPKVKWPADLDLESRTSPEISCP